MSGLLTLGVLQQARNKKEDTLYSGTLTVGFANIHGGNCVGLRKWGGVGNIDPTDDKLITFEANYMFGDYGGSAYYDDIIYFLANMEIDGIIYTLHETLYNYLKNAYDNDETVKIKLYEDAP